MLTVSPLKDISLGAFKKMFCDYYAELDCADDTAHLLDEYVLPDMLAGFIKIDVLKDGEAFAGFIIYQTDDITNDWNFKEGWGDVRELYVAPEYRKKGYGKFLLYTAEMKLRESGVNKAYCLPCEGTENFFTACGYVRSDGYNAELDCIVYEKTNLNNCECK